MNSHHTTRQGLLLAVLVFCTIAGPAWADPRNDVLYGAQRCASITNDRSWLDCYYGAAQPMRSQLGLPPAPAEQQGLVPPAIAGQPVYTPAFSAESAMAAAPSGPPPMPRRRNDGFFSSLLGGRTVVGNMRVSSYSAGNGPLTVTLTDGQVWEQVSDDASQANWHEPASHYIVNIQEGAMGTYRLQSNDSNILYKVRRVK